MPRGAAEVADVFRRYGNAYRQQQLLTIDGTASRHDSDRTVSHSQRFDRAVVKPLGDPARIGKAGRRYISANSVYEAARCHIFA
jgi:hypothetical protein